MGKKKEVVIKAEAETKKKKKAEVIEAVVAVETKSKEARKPVRRQHGKQYLKAKAKVDSNKAYSFKEAVELLKKAAFEKFDSAVEMHLNLQEKGLKGEVTLPHGTGREVKIAIFDDAVEAKIQANKIDFDVLIASTKDMAKLVKYAKILGPKGLMPSPKKGTLTDKVDEAVKKLSSGIILYKGESKFPLLHQNIGRKSFTEEQLVENIIALLKAVGRKNITEAYLKTSMSPSIKLDLANF